MRGIGNELSDVETSKEVLEALRAVEELVRHLAKQAKRDPSIARAALRLMVAVDRFASDIRDHDQGIA